jgi:dTDP-4-dehydrorhamnose 3,5-epimerase
MNIMTTPLDGLLEIQGDAIVDERGSFNRLFCDFAFSSIRPNLHFCQINLSRTSKSGTVRGLHFQKPPSAEAKLIRCLKGRAYDVAVDIRSGSSTFLHWHAIELSPGANNSVFIPEGFAHGFQSLEDDTELLYFHTAPWRKQDEGALRYNDPQIAIQWPSTVSSISDKDRNSTLIDADFMGLHL